MLTHIGVNFISRPLLDAHVEMTTVRCSVAQSRPPFCQINVWPLLEAQCTDEYVVVPFLNVDIRLSLFSLRHPKGVKETGSVSPSIRPRI